MPTVALTAFFSALGTMLGWKGIMALVWVAVMALDYLTGSAAVEDAVLAMLMGGLM